MSESSVVPATTKAAKHSREERIAYAKALIEKSKASLAAVRAMEGNQEAATKDSIYQAANAVGGAVLYSRSIASKQHRETMAAIAALTEKVEKLESGRGRGRK